MPTSVFLFVRMSPAKTEMISLSTLPVFTAVEPPAELVSIAPRISPAPTEDDELSVVVVPVVPKPQLVKSPKQRATAME